MRPFTDEELVAYVDGELAGARAEEIARAEQADKTVADRIAVFVESRRALRDAFSGKLDEPVPDRLLRALAADVPPKVVPLRPRRRRWPLWISLAAAASVVAAIVLKLDHGTTGAPGPDAAIALIDAALETRPSGVPLATASGEVVPLSTLRTQDGRWCREFEARADSGGERRRSSGVACRQGDGHWEAVASGAAAPDRAAPGGGYETASGDATDLPPALGPARRVTPAEESAQIEQRWSTP